jgi:hypothetical protein
MFGKEFHQVSKTPAPAGQVITANDFGSRRSELRISLSGSRRLSPRGITEGYAQRSPHDRND